MVSVRFNFLCHITVKKLYLISSLCVIFQSMIVDDYLQDAQKYFGNSTGFIESMKVIRGQKSSKNSKSREEKLREALEVCSCSYENNTKWGTEASVDDMHIDTIFDVQFILIIRCS